MTLFGWDASHYDGRLTTAIMAKAKTDGVAFFTHKVGEGTGGDDAEDATALAAARDAGIEFIGGYHVVRSGPVSPQVDAALALADRDEPWWRQFPGWFWQVDLERWSYDSVPASTGIAFGRELRQRTGRTVVLYASRGQYGDQLAGWDGPLWNARYGTNPVGSLKGTYPGDDSAGWQPYSGQTPTFLQYGSRVTIAGLTTCDANAYRGTLAELTALLTGDDMSVSDVIVGLSQLFDEAANRSTANGRNFGNDVNTLLDARLKPIEDAIDALAARPAATGDVATLAQAVADALRPELEAAAEAAVRKVLGAVDGATPTGS